MPVFSWELTVVLGLLTAALTGAGVYIARKNGLETEKEREEHLKNRLKGRTIPTDTWGITVDDIVVIEKSGLPYRVKKIHHGWCVRGNSCDSDV